MSPPLSFWWDMKKYLASLLKFHIEHGPYFSWRLWMSKDDKQVFVAGAPTGCTAGERDDSYMHLLAAAPVMYAALLKAQEALPKSAKAARQAIKEALEEAHVN